HWPGIRESARIPTLRKARRAPIGWDAVLGRAQRPGIAGGRRDTLGWGSQIMDKDQHSVASVGSGMRDLLRMSKRPPRVVRRPPLLVVTRRGDRTGSSLARSAGAQGTPGRGHDRHAAATRAHGAGPRPQPGRTPAVAR